MAIDLKTLIKVEVELPAVNARSVDNSLEALEMLTRRIIGSMEVINERIRSGMQIHPAERDVVSQLLVMLISHLNNIIPKQGSTDIAQDNKYVQEHIDDFTQRCIEDGWFTEEQAEDRVKRGIHWYQPISHNECKSVNVEIPTVLLDDEDNEQALRDELWEVESQLSQSGELEDSTYEDPELIIDDV